MKTLISFLLHSVILALPTGNTTAKESANEPESSDETEEDSGPSSTEDGDASVTSTGKEKTEPNDNIETATKDFRHDKYSTVLPRFEHCNEERQCEEYGSPGTQYRYTESDLSLNAVEQKNLFWRSPTGHVASETNSLGHGKREIRRPVTEDQESVSWGTLSEDNLSVDARACALPKRRPKGAKTKADKLGQTEEKTCDKEKRHHTKEEEKMKRQDALEDFIRQLVHQQVSPQARVKFFDAAIVYEKEDYSEALNFREEVIMIVKSALNEEVRIELFDSEEFAQSKIIVVEDVLNKCSLVFVYLTINFRSPELKFFIEEAIGMSRLGLHNQDIQAGTSHNERQWVLKPIHTMPPKYRAYRVPTGLLSVNGIEWYNKDSAHTRQQICAVMHTAIHTRKEREKQVPISHLPRQIVHQNPRRDIPDRHVQGLSNLSKQNIENTGQNTHQHLISHQSHDAMSVVQDSVHLNRSDYHSLPGGHNYFPTRENLHNSLHHIPLSQTNQVNTYEHVNGTNLQNAFHGPLNHRYGPIQDMNRTLPPTMSSELVQNGQYPYTFRQAGQHYISSQAYQQQPPQPRAVYQSAGLHNRNEQSSVHGNGNISYHANQPGDYLHKSYAPVGHNGQIYNHPNAYMAPVQQIGLTRHPRNDPSYTSQRNMSGMSGPASYWQGNPQVQSQIQGGVPNNRYGMYQQVPLRQQDMTVQQQFSQYQDQPLTRDALRSESGNFLFDQRNDAPPSTQLSVVSKVTGKLIVNPNLSTDDVEVDNYVTTHSSHTKVPAKSGKGKTNRMRRQMHAEYESEDSSSDSDFDTPKYKLKRGKQKVVNVVGCKIVQMGSRNKVKENANKYSVADEFPVVKSNCDEVKMNHSPESIGTSSATTSISTPSLDQTSALESNILSTDNMSAGSSILRNLDSGKGEKPVADKIDIPGRVPGDSDERLHRRDIVLTHLNSVEPGQEPSLETNDISNADRDTNAYCEKFHSFQSQGSAKKSECPNSPDDNLSDSGDYLFESGTYSLDIPKVAPFTFSNAKSCRINVLRRSIKVNTLYIKQANEESEID
ncbi:uncharacterized protein LOC128547859 [Mercenaria mercenaria]|uniref:uncharacterized protein LOC128547859 n=1 Tax=Mercenaria mercenaria TaxID=6596 RepID=UPI00234E5A6D|nr:uncharacterized protein LOC128547859 [Mercenaria mercenaria]